LLSLNIVSLAPDRNPGPELKSVLTQYDFTRISDWIGSTSTPGAAVAVNFQFSVRLQQIIDESEEIVYPTTACPE
jgi:hypothetical protein